MPKRTDISSIIIGQACEFDYSGTQARIENGWETSVEIGP